MEISKQNKLLKLIIGGVFLIYILILFKIVLFKYSGIIDFISGNKISFRSLNIIPFKMFLTLRNEIESMGFIWAISNSLGNLLIFAPFGYLIPIVFKKINNISSIIVTSFSLSLFLELSQYILSIGSADIDDIILNTLGGIAGYLIYKLISKVLNEDKKLYIGTILLAIICLSGAFFVAKDEFGNLLGLARFEQEVIGDDLIPTSKADFIGTYKESFEEEIIIYEGMIFANADKSLLSELSINIQNDTKIFNTIMENSKNKLTIKYEEYLGSLANIDNNSILSVWGNKVDGKILAEVITIQKPMEDNSDIDINSNNVEVNVPIVNDNTIAIPNEKSNIDGHVKSIYNNIIEATLIQTSEYSDNIISVQTDTLVNIKINGDTEFILKKITASGEEISIGKGSISDISEKDMISVWGMNIDKILKAKTILIIKIE